MSTIDTVRDYDPVTLEVIRMRLDAIVDEMAIAMMRSSGSPVITEAGDCNTALFDAEGRIYAYSNYVQFHIGSATVALRGLLDAVALEDMEPGDAFISNDSHTAGSTHPPDVSVITPIFHDGRVVAFAQSQAHLLDIGGMNPGGFAPSAVDCFAEALRMPPGVKCYERGEPVESVRRMIVNNVRLPIIFWNDVRSLVASNNTGRATTHRHAGRVRRRHIRRIRRAGDHGGEGRRSRRASPRSRTGSTRRTNGRRETGRSPTCCRSTAG